MHLTVEFYGIARQRAGTEQVTLDDCQARTLGEAITELANRFPDFARDCTDGQVLSAGFRANLDGSRFGSDPDTSLTGTRTLLIMSADAGG
jgi:molybdopterin converting factor small subunit